jgi:hypothetical protein
MEDLDRNVTTVLSVLGQVDGGHSPAPDLPLQVIAIAEGGLQAVLEAGHGMKILGGHDQGY